VKRDDVQQQSHVKKDDINDVESDSSLKWFVTFYVTNFPPHASTFFLRKGFEFCGILEDFFVANNRNKNSEVYAFVWYAKVRDVDKLLKALNNVCFGQYCVRVVLAKFDKKGSRKGDVVRKGEGVGGEEGGKVEGMGSVEGIKVGNKGSEGEKSKDGDVRVRSVLVRVRVRGKGKMGTESEGGRAVCGGEKGTESKTAGTDKLTMTTKLVRKYTSD